MISIAATASTISETNITIRLGECFILSLLIFNTYDRYKSFFLVTNMESKTFELTGNVAEPDLSSSVPAPEHCLVPCKRHNTVE